MPMTAVSERPSTAPLYFCTSSLFRKKVAFQRNWEIAQSIHPDIDEKAIRHANPAKLCVSISLAKAQTVLERLRAQNLKGFILTFDQVAVCNGEIREKPETMEEAYGFLKSYNQYPAETYSAVAACNIETGLIKCRYDHAVVEFDPFSDKEICALIKQSYVMKCAGAFVLGMPEFDSHIKSISKGTRESIIGIPIELTQHVLNQVGYTGKLL